MANTSAPFGFLQWSGQGSAPTYEQVPFPIAYDNATPIYWGDPAMIDATTGQLIVGSAGTAPLAGIFVGCSYNATAMNNQLRYSNYWPGSGAVSGSVTGFVVNDPNAMWLAQFANSASVGGTQAEVGENFQFALGSGSALTGMSGAYVDVTSKNTTSTLPFKLHRLWTTPPGQNGTQAGVYNWGIFQFNNVMTKALTGIA